MATLAAVTNVPALALLGEDGKLEHGTEPFRRWFADKEELCKQSPELQRVLDGQANAAILKLDGVAVDIAAVSDRAGARHILLTLPTEELPSLGDAGSALLDGALDESPAIVWLKDLDGRYVRANSRFTSFLGTTEEKLLGRTDAELPPAETVDGPRLEDREDDFEEPLQLEYMVGPYQGRDALVVLRFPVGDAKGVPALVCGVAAPSSDAQVARSEAARLLRIERWSRLDADSVRAEMLADWGVLPDVRGRSAPSTSTAEPSSGVSDREQQAAVAEARAERATAVCRARRRAKRQRRACDGAQGGPSPADRARAQPRHRRSQPRRRRGGSRRPGGRPRSRIGPRARTRRGARALARDGEAAAWRRCRCRADRGAACPRRRRCRADRGAACPRRRRSRARRPGGDAGRRRRGAGGGRCRTRVRVDRPGGAGARGKAGSGARRNARAPAGRQRFRARSCSRPRRRAPKRRPRSPTPSPSAMPR